MKDQNLDHNQSNLAPNYESQLKPPIFCRERGCLIGNNKFRPKSPNCGRKYETIAKTQNYDCKFVITAENSNFDSILKNLPQNSELYC